MNIKTRTLSFKMGDSYIALRSEANVTSVIVSGVDIQGKDTAEVEIVLDISQLEDIRNFLILAVDEYTLTRKSTKAVKAQD